MSEPLIDPERVVEVLGDCLGENSDTVIVIEGIMSVYHFRQEKLKEHREEIAGFLMNLPLPFRSAKVGGGGGWSFLNACDDANGVQWTGMHRTMEALFCLGLALDLVKWALPRDVWSALPGGMPYVIVKV